MTIQQFIEAAIEGGWSKWLKTGHYWIDGPFILWKANIIKDDFEIRKMVFEEMFLDPEAWKAVGISKEKEMEKYAVQNGIFISSERWMWESYMRRMVDALISGKTLEAYITTL